MSTTTAPHPPASSLVYMFEGWTPTPPVPAGAAPIPAPERFFLAESVLQAVRDAHNGVTIPRTLVTDAVLQAFAGAAAIPTVDADVEPGIVFPNYVFASRPYLHQLYASFLAWATGSWLGDGLMFQLDDEPEVEDEGDDFDVGNPVGDSPPASVPSVKPKPAKPKHKSAKPKPELTDPTTAE